jgi:O-antigen ligase
LRALDVQLYRLSDDLSGALILPMVVFSPWAFGTTEPWSIWCMNWGGFALGILLLLKLFIRLGKQYPAPRWDHFSARSGTWSRHRHRATRLLTRVLAGLTLAVLGYILTSALNVAADYDTEARLFQYHQYLTWLPHSFDGHRTWFHFWMYLGLAASFWSIVDWLPGMSSSEERAALTSDKDKPGRVVPLLPARLRTLLWVLCLNGAVLGLEAIVQRVSGSNKLLFLVVPHVHKTGESQFGPYAYRANAAQFFNLLWPLCLGFWWALQRTAGVRKAHHWLLLCAAIMAACPIISTARGGALVSAGMLLVVLFYLALPILFGGDKRTGGGSSRRGVAGLLLLFLAVVLALGWYLGWRSLEPRLEQIGEGYQYREAMYAAAQPMAKDYPLFGTGPGTFATVFYLYLVSTDTYWPAQLHNDWLETRITFGWLGFGLLLAALACVGLRWFVPGGIQGSRRFVVLAWLALAGCLVQARFDFPFQIHSTLWLFLVICAVLFGISGQTSGGRR